VGGYAVGLIVFAILLYPHYDFFQRETDTPTEAVDFFITDCGILVGFAPMAVLPLILIVRAISLRQANRRKTRSGSASLLLLAAELEAQADAVECRAESAPIP
jgi:hypothetical protein